MKEKGLTIPALAARITITDKDNNKRTLTPAALGARINGNPSLSNLYEIADALGVKITELFPEEDQWRGGADSERVPVGFRMQTICPACGAHINASITAECQKSHGRDCGTAVGSNDMG